MNGWIDQCMYCIYIWIDGWIMGMDGWIMDIDGLMMDGCIMDIDVYEWIMYMDGSMVDID